MKHLKILGVGLVAAAALMAFVGASTASATILEKEGGVKMVAGEELHAVVEGVAVLNAGINVECEEGTVKGTIENPGSATETVRGPASSVTFGKCNCPTVDVTGGTLEIHYIEGSNGNGTLTASGFTATVTCNTIFGAVTCRYITGNGKDLGTLTGSTTTGGTATMDISTTLTTETPDSSICAENATWNAKYKVTTPDVLNVTKS